jgi:hypothetical protein
MRHVRKRAERAHLGHAPALNDLDPYRRSNASMSACGTAEPPTNIRVMLEMSY